MQFITILIQLSFVLDIVIPTSGFFFSKSEKHKHNLIAAKYDPEMPRKVRKILEQIGDHRVLKIQLGRTPVEAVFLLFLNLVSSWKFADKQLELGYDEIYHNYLLITIQDEVGPNVLQNIFGTAEDTISSTVYKLDKAHRVRLMKPIFPTEFVDVYNIPLTLNKTFTLNRLITTASNIDKHFYTYDAANNNMCQTFVENIVDINGLTSNIVDDTTRVALKPQDAKALVATLGSRSDIVKRITDLGGTLDKWVFDRKIKWKKPLIKEFALFGNMHVKIADDTGAVNNTDDLLQSSADTVAVNGMADTIIENVDDVFNAAVALEDDDSNIKRNKILLIVGIILLIILIVTAAIIVFFLWRKRKNKLMKKQSINSIIDNVQSDASLNEITDVTEN